MSRPLTYDHTMDNLHVRVYFYIRVRSQVNDDDAEELVKLSYQAVKACGDSKVKVILIRSDVHDGATTAAKPGWRITIAYKDGAQVGQSDTHRSCHGLVRKKDARWELHDWEPSGLKEDKELRAKYKRVNGKKKKYLVDIWPQEGDEELAFEKDYEISALEAM